MSVNGISSYNGYNEGIYSKKAQNNNKKPVSFGSADNGYSSSVANSYIQKQQAQKQEMELKNQKKNKWKEFWMDVLKGVTIGGTIIVGTVLIASSTKAGREMTQTILSSAGLSSASGNTEKFKKLETTNEISYEKCKEYLQKNLAISEEQQAKVIEDICTANKKIRTGKYDGKDINPAKNRGIIMYGRGGIGKSYAMETIAKACGASYLSIKGADFMSKYQGQSEAILQGILNDARAKAKETPDEPVIVFLDEGESILGDGRTDNGNNTNANLRSLFLGAMETKGTDALPSNVKFIVTTNYVDDIDEPYRRDGRLGIPMEIQCPDADGQASIMRSQFKEQLKGYYQEYEKIIDDYITDRTTFLQMIEGSTDNEAIRKALETLKNRQNDYNKAEQKLNNAQAELDKSEAEATDTKDAKEKVEAAKKKVETDKKALDAAKRNLDNERAQISQGRYYNFTPAEIKGFVAEAVELLSCDSKYENGLTKENLKQLEQAKIDELRKAASEIKSKKKKSLF